MAECTEKVNYYTQGLTEFRLYSCQSWDYNLLKLTFFLLLLDNKMYFDLNLQIFFLVYGNRVYISSFTVVTLFFLWVHIYFFCIRIYTKSDNSYTKGGFYF